MILRGDILSLGLVCTCTSSLTNTSVQPCVSSAASINDLNPDGSYSATTDKSVDAASCVALSKCTVCLHPASLQVTVRRSQIKLKDR